MNWINAKDQAPPTDQRIWAYIKGVGIRKLRYGTKEYWAEIEGGKPEDFIDCWVEVDDLENEWAPKFWLPEDAIPEPPTFDTV